MQDASAWVSAIDVDFPCLALDLNFLFRCVDWAEVLPRVFFRFGSFFDIIWENGMYCAAFGGDAISKPKTGYGSGVGEMQYSPVRCLLDRLEDVSGM